MKRWHIALVGSQTYPVYLGIKEMKADEVVLVHSSSTKKEAERIRHEVPVNTRLMELAPVDIEEIYRSVRELRNRYMAQEDAELSINLTGGTKLWSLVFYEYFRSLSNVRLMYVDQNNAIYDLISEYSYLSKEEVDIDLIFRLNGVPSVKKTPLSDYTGEDQNVCNHIKHLRNRFPESFREIAIPDKAHSNLLQQRQGEYTIGANKVRWDWDAPGITVWLTDKKGRSETEYLCSPHVQSLFFQTGWFEYDVARMLDRWIYRKQVYMNVELPYAAGTKTKNEIDIVVNTGNRLLFVECKTQIFDTTAIDKFRTVVKNFGGMGAKALFVTSGPMKPEAAEKCRESGILAFSMSDYKHGSGRRVEEGLYALLEEGMSLINTK